MLNNNHLFLDLHVIQTLPPSNINRDDTGSPKTALYGGARRARVSSQSWKRAMRKYFYEYSEKRNVGVRSLDTVRYVAEKIIAIDPSYSEEMALKASNSILNTAGIKTTKDLKMKALFFIGSVQAEELAKAAIDKVDDKEKIKEILRNNPAIDIALFGRMVADDPSLNEDASSQVAHAISTHAVQTEYDFYTAVDDMASEDNAGAGMLGTVEFNSSTMYRYANIAVHELINQLGDRESAIRTIQLFTEAFSNSLPTGKVNTFANQTVPQALLVTLRRDRPINLVTAFEKPVRSKEGYVEESIKRLADEFEKVEKFVEKPLASMVVSFDENENLNKIAEKQDSLGTLIDALGKYIGENLA